MYRARTTSATAYEPSVLLIVAGGTICMQDTADGLKTSQVFLDECLSPNYQFNDGTPIPPTDITDEHGVRRAARSLRLPRDRSGANVLCTVLEFAPLLDSAVAHAPTWNQLAQTLHANMASFDAFVICHGTDTLAYTAAALSFLFMSQGRLEKTVVLTGAQRSMFFADSDGGANLLGSIVLASHVRLPEVTVYFGHKLLRGTRVTKVSASNYAGFESPNAGPLCAVSETGIVVYGDNLQEKKKQAQSSPEHPANDDDEKPLPHLDSSTAIVLKVHPGMTAALLSTILSSPSLRGVILETFGAGNLPVSLVPALSGAVARGITVVNVTQCLHGSVSTAYEPARKLAEAGIVAGYDMTTEAAYTKLVYLLARPDLGPAEVKSCMAENLCGELTPPPMEKGGIDGPLSVAQLPIRVERTVTGRFTNFGG
ncbi:Asparaginase/glutaminase [Dissoconium aciculare CBS 342.82]|uniref:asparaginase n=1 Tax=Dissoconium aciculare CBS 342.82 TaxID=1314786 RepID=A0A6J3M203_9PEZI|nr:Asparaginase/glutaminase [Dissoconium aciculare CBS 342.82]KAF1822050.1 Asparaginase/glutaminase [Dissoconium aciculare CBS 342.82]